MKTNGLSYCRNLGSNRKSLISEGVIPIRGQPPRLVSQAAIESLVRFISTPETDAIYGQLWDVARAVQSGDIASAQMTLGFSQDAAIEKFEEVLTRWKAERAAHKETLAKLKVAEKTKGQIASSREAKVMGLYSAQKQRTAKAESKVIELESAQGLSGEYRTILAWTKEYPQLEGKTLGSSFSNIAKRLGLPAKDTAVTNEFGTLLKMWHRSIVLEYIASCV